MYWIGVVKIWREREERRRKWECFEEQSPRKRFFKWWESFPSTFSGTARMYEKPRLTNFKNRKARGT